MEMILFKKLDLEEIEQLEKNKLVFYTKDNNKTFYGGYVNKFGEGFLTKRKYLLINSINKEGKIIQDRIYIDNEELNIYAWKEIVDTEHIKISEGEE